MKKILRGLSGFLAACLCGLPLAGCAPQAASSSSQNNALSESIAPASSTVSPSNIPYPYTEAPPLQTQATPAPMELLKDFDHTGYELPTSGDINGMGSILGNSTEVFFIKKEKDYSSWDHRTPISGTLYYSDGHMIYEMFTDVYALAGSRDDNIYLVQKDTNVKRLSHETDDSGKYTSSEKQGSLIQYNPATGKATTLIQGVENA